jgi:isopentenyl diphosphate isomerase/L-lactate dehydrogenase-like FMN-dependent dehydrogenase
MELPATIAEYERLAAETLPPGPYGFFAGGAGDEVTLADNVLAWRRWQIRPRVLVDVSSRDPGTVLLGRARPHPVLVAPTAFHRLAHPDGELATGRAARDTGTVMCLSTFSTVGAGELAEAVPDGTRWFQLYVFRDRGVTTAMVDAAVAGGYEALVVTVDLPVLGRRERDLRSGFVIQEPTAVPGLSAGAARGPLSLAQTAELLDPTLTWRDLAWLAERSGLPVLVKGVLTAEDAALAVAHGAAGVIVSNHGGRQLDGVPASADALPEVVERVGGAADVLVDGGVRRGTDVLKALALGARAVLVGRPVLWGLAASGEDGVRHVLELLLAEFDNALALAGAPRAAALGRAWLRRAGA